MDSSHVILLQFYILNFLDNQPEIYGSMNNSNTLLLNMPVLAVNYNVMMTHDILV